MNSLYKHSIRDNRVREYLPPVRVLLSENTKHPENLLGENGIQVYLYHFNASQRATTLRPGGMVLLDYGVELAGGIRINVSGEGGKIRIRFGESVSEALNTPNQDHAIHDAELQLPRIGMLEYGNTGFRFISIVNTGNEALTLFSVYAVALYRNLELAGSFQCSDERLNKIWDTAVYTLQLCMQDYIYDGIKRDRLLWMGDMHPEVRGILAAFNDTSLVEKSLDFMVRTTNPNRGMNDCWSYSMWYLICLRDYFFATGNYSFLESQREAVFNIMEHLEQFIGDDGSEQIPETRFLDWPTRDNEVATHAGLQGLMLWAFRALEDLMKYYDLPSARTIEAQQKLRRHCPPCGGSKSAAALQMISGLCDRTEIIENDPFHGISTFMGFCILLAKNTVPALELIRKYWGAMLDFGATTFWEDFDLDWIKNAARIDELPVPGKDDLHADFGAWCYKGLRHSLCHGWSCGPMPFMSERILGIEFLEPGGKKIRFAPDAGGLDYVKGAYPTAYGKVAVEMKSAGKWEISAPSEIDIVE